MKLVIALGLLATVCSAWSNEGREWRFDWDGQSATGISEAGSQWSAQRVHARAHVTFLSHRSAVLRLHDIKTMTAHREFSTPRTFLPLNYFEEQQLSDEKSSIAQLPVRFHYHAGRVADLEFDENDQPWSENIKRSIINMIQINLAKQERSEKFESLSTENEGDYFTIQEKTLEGDCESVYTVVKTENKMEVTKSVNFEKCTKRMDIRYNHRFGEECPECSESKMTDRERNLKSQSVYTYKLKGTEKDFVIQEVEVKSQYVLASFNKEQQLLSAYGISKLALVEETTSGKVEMPKNTKKSSLFYNIDTELSREQWLMTGEEKYLERAGYPKMDKVAVVEKLVKHIVKDMKTEKNGAEVHVSHLMARLVEVLRTCSRNEILSLHKRICDSDSQDKTSDLMRGIFYDALSMSGSFTTLEHLVEMITEKKVEHVKAAELVKAFVNTPTPSVRIVELLIKLSKENVVRRNPILEQSIWLTTGALMNGVCGNHEDKLAITISNMNQCTVQQKKQFIHILDNKFHESVTLYEKVLALKTIANAGLDLSIHILEKVIYDNSEPTTVRMQAIDALRQIRTQMPRKIQQVLMPLYKSRSETPEVRMTALYQIMQSLPQRMVIDQIVEQITKERNQQVASFTYSLLNQFATSETPCERKMSEDIQVALRMIKEDTRQMLTSRIAHFPLFSEMLQIGTTFDFASIFSSDSILPKEIMASIDTVFAGQWTKYFAQIGFSQQNIDKMLIKLLSKLEKSEVSESRVRGRRSDVRPVEMLRKLVEKMNIKTRRVENEKDSHALLYIRYKNLDFAVLPIDEKTINQIASGVMRRGSFDFEEIQRVLSEGYRFRTQIATFFYEPTRIIATSAGIPLKLVGKMPTVSTIEGVVKIELQGQTIRVHIAAQPSVASTHVLEMQLLAPVYHSGSKLVHSAQMNIPVDATFELNWNKKLQMKTIIKTPKNEKRMLLISTRPTTYLRFIDEESKSYPEPMEKTVVVRKLEKTTVNYENTFGEELFGLEWNVFGSVPRHMIEERSLEGFMIGENHIEVIVRPTETTPREYVVDFESTLEQVEVNEQPRFERFHKINKKNFFETDKHELLEEDEHDRVISFNEYTKNVKLGKAYKNRVLIKAYTVGGEIKRSSQLEMKSVCDSNVRYCRIQIDGKRTPLLDESEQWDLKATAQILYPETVLTLKQLKEQKHREVQGEIDAEWGSEKKSSVHIKLQGEQSREMKKWIKVADRKIEGISQYELLKEAAQLNQYKIVADYEVSPYYKLAVEKVWGLIKAYNYLGYNSMPATNEHGRLYIRLSVEPETRRYMNLSIESSDEKFEMTQMRSAYRIPLLNIARQTPINKIQKLAIRAECEVKSNKVRTFDDLLYKTPLTTCYSVLAKDCSEEPEFAVLLKKVNKRGEEKKIKIVSEENVIEIEMIDESLECKVNGKRVSDEERLQEFNIEKINEQLYHIELPQVIVKFDGYTAQIKMSQLLQNQQCGLCGHFDGQNDNEFRRADNEMTDDIEDFHRSFLSRDDECTVEETELSEKKNYKIIEQSEETEMNSWEDSNIWDDEWESRKQKSSRSNEETESEPIKKTNVMESRDHICFSMEQIPECPSGQQIVDTVPTKTSYQCLPRNDRRATRMMRDSRRGVKVALEEDLPIAFVKSMEVPTACYAY